MDPHHETISRIRHLKHSVQLCQKCNISSYIMHVKQRQKRILQNNKLSER